MKNNRSIDKDTFIIINECGGLPFEQIKNKILGKKYELSLVFVGEKKIQALNKTYRKVDSPTDILSFPIDKNSGEIFICQKIAQKKAKDFPTFGRSAVGRERSLSNFIAFLFVHGNVHLLGYDHGKKMEAVEVKFRKFFKI